MKVRVTVILGTQWGDEGKGKLVDILSKEIDLCARCQGGNNAGHTIVTGNQIYDFHILPSGLVNSNSLNLIGSGVVIHIPSFFAELEMVEKKGISTKDRIFISDRAHLVLDYHLIVDGLKEVELGEYSIGTTKKGIGPAYSNKAERSGIRVHHLFDFPEFERLLHQNLQSYRTRYGPFEFDVEKEIEKYKLQDYAEKLRSCVVDAVYFIHSAIMSKKRILVEGANALMLDIDYGTYPYVTSSNTSIGGVCTGLGLPPKNIKNVIGVMKAYTTRVGFGPFPTELLNNIGEHLQQVGSEWGVTTGRKRRCGWLDLVLVRYSNWINGYSGLMITKLDVLDALEEIKIGIAYKINGEEIPYISADLKTLKNVHVEYKTIPGWQKETKGYTNQTYNEMEKDRIVNNTTSGSIKQAIDSSNNSIFALWQSTTLSNILQVTLDEENYLKTPNYMFLSSLRQELIDESQEPVISVDTLDRVILARLSIPTQDRPFDYLVTCWKRSVAVEKMIQKSADVKEKMNVIKESKRLFVSYSGLSITLPEMFELQYAPIDLASRLLQELDTNEGIPFDFIKELIYQFDEEGTLADLLGETVVELSRRLSKKTIMDDYQPYIKVFNQLVTLKPFTLMITHLPSWLPENSTATNIEYDSILGPYLRLTPMQVKISELYFSNTSQRFQTDILGSINSLRLTMRTLQNQLFFITNTIVRTSPECKNKILEYFAKVLELNKKRKALHVDPKTISTDGYIVNITNIINAFSEPFIDINYTKIDKIDINYFKKKPRIDIMKETKLNADEKTSELFYKDKIDDIPNFISEIFFLNVAYHYYGLNTAMLNHEHIMKMISDLQKQYDILESQKSHWTNVTTHASILNSNMEQLHLQINKTKSHCYCFDTMLLDDVLQSKSFSFLCMLASWLLRLVDPKHQHPQNIITLPLPQDPNDHIRNLPEYFIEGIADFFLYTSKYNPELIASNSSGDLVIFIITFLKNSSYIKNPYLKAKLAEILFYGILKQRNYPHGVLEGILNTNTFSLQHLLPALMSFYIEVESTGLSSQFYDKFNIRYQISQIFKAIWENPGHREKLLLESRNNFNFFVKFVALLLNDATYLLDEALSKLLEIHNLQLELENVPENLSFTDERQDKRHYLIQLEKYATTYMSLATETIELLKRFTASIPDAFCCPEVVDRLAAMLDYNINALVGPKCSKLKVRNPEKYRFEPKSLLSNIADIYLNLRLKKSFITAIAKDGRSYKKDLFFRATQIFKKYSTKSLDDINNLLALVDEVEEVKKREEDNEELGEIPEEFLVKDPIMACLMTNPVILPSSRVTVDMATIKSHLLSEEKDPFNRSPLKLEDLVPNNELKAKLEKFKAERKAIKKKQASKNDNPSIE
ncbi:hypothetical protein PCANB_002307 [Pneumocystis canis]|nr:hypothetical protein PCANB_002307 [Pneumocystis canis]